MRETMKYNPCYYQLREGQLQRMLAIVQQTKTAKKNGVVFFGDSITEMYNLSKYFPKIKNVYNCGIGGATSNELLWIVDEAVIKYQPKIVVMMIGINDLGNTVMFSPKDIAVNVKNIIDLIRGNCPDTQIILLSTLPCIETLRDYHHVPGIRCNDLVAMIFKQYQELIIDQKTTLLSVFDDFINSQNEALVEYYQDGLHLNDKGYQHLTQLITPVIEKYL
ncbi:GDSL-type esterase/lipase family protein [uncultured Thomasclavelia sp.]|uniref:SGNH/GDSL hydrolase family protein n=1 Tax=uncultured Thomasclavelia sp. TaxID=3025759 RepID=UPI0025E823F7|nr:GDSL-type esterase/lipase family protein [uncultured Thomasclavelia sp.]